MDENKIFYLRKKNSENSKYYDLAFYLWKNYMVSLSHGMKFESFKRLMSQRPDIQDDAEDIWMDLIEEGNLYSK